MPISLEQQLLFVRIPNETDSEILEQLPFLTDKGHHGVSYYLDNHQGAFSKTRKFCVVRNPWDRFTLFFEQVRDNEEYVDHELIKDKSFAEFVQDFTENRDSYRNPAWLPQTAWIWSEYGPIMNHIFLEDAEYLKNPQVTTINSQFKTVLDLEVEVPEIDRDAALERRKNYYTDPSLVEKVSEIFKNDIDVLGYVYDVDIDEVDNPSDS